MPDLVSLKEWQSRTSVIGRRSTEMREIDKLYEAYLGSRSEINARRLHLALDQYLASHKGHWSLVERNVKSGGLMQALHEQTAYAVSGAQTLASRDRRMLESRIPETRHGVLYLWSNTNVETQFGKIFLEGAMSLGATAVSSASTLQNFAKDDPRSIYYGIGSGVGTVAAIGAGAWRSAATASQVSASVPTTHTAPMPTPSTRGRSNAVVSRPPLILPPPRPVLPPRPLVRRPAVMSLHDMEMEDTRSNFAKFRHVLGVGFDKILTAIRDGIYWIWSKIVQNQGAVIGALSKGIEKLVMYVVGKVCEAAVPLVGAAIDLGRGVAQTIKGIKDRLEAYFARSKFVVAPGHPTLIANAIEKQMNWAIGKGLFNVIKGGAKLGLTFVTAGASAIIDAIAAGLEFATKFILRLIEGKAITAFIADVREACKNKDSENRPTIVHSAKDFNALFSKGCDASACVPMMTLNSGITGDQMMFMKMFDDTTRGSQIGQTEFDAATGYFTKLKSYGAEYVRNSGFTFSSAKKDVQGYLHHAVVHHAAGNMSAADAALKFLG